MTIWSSQLRHNFFNHALFSCVKQEIDRIKGCILRNVAFCVGMSTAVLAMVLHWVQKHWLPWFEPLCSPSRNTGKQDDFLGCPRRVRFAFGKHESWGRQWGDGQDAGSQEFIAQLFYLSDLHFQASGCWHLVMATSILCCIPGVCEKAQTSIFASFHMPGHPGVLSIHANYIAHFSLYYSMNAVTPWMSHF